MWKYTSTEIIWCLTTTILVLVVCLINQDNDFPLPNGLLYLALFNMTFFLIVGLFKDYNRRLILLLSIVFIPSLIIFLGEFYFKYHNENRYFNRSSNERIQTSTDLLLRFQFRPGARMHPLTEDKKQWQYVNSQGLNSPEFSLTKPEGTYRIAIVGDSVPNDGQLLFGQLFPQRLSDQLNESLFNYKELSIRRVEVINVSCEGYNTLQEIRLLENVGVKYSPNLVIVAYVLNDPWLQNAEIGRMGNSFFLNPFILMLKLHLYELFNMPVESLFKTIHEGYNFELVVGNSFERLRLLSEIHHFKVIVAILPIFQNFNNHTYINIYEKVAKTAEKQGFTSIILFNQLRNYSTAPFQKKHDLTHCNSDGHAAIAEVLAEFVENQGFPGK